MRPFFNHFPTIFGPTVATAIAVIISSGPIVLAQSGATGGAEPLQGGVRTLDAAASQRPTMTINIPAYTAAPGFFENGQTLQGAAHTEQVKPEVFRGWLTENHSKFALTSNMISDGLIVDVAGRWDHADKTLTKFGINFTHIRPSDINPEILGQARVLIINCAGNVRRDRLQAIRDFVQKGGYLLTTDWALNNMLEQTFPGYVSWDKGFNTHSVYSAIYTNPDPVLARGCVRSASWKLDEGAHLVRILRPDVVRILVRSPDLSQEDPDHQGILACMFPFGKGFVLHMVGHFDNNAPIAIGNFLPDPAPKIGISLRQALAANFVVAGVTGVPIPTSAP